MALAVRIGQRQRSGRGQVPGKIGGIRRAALAGKAGEWLLARLAKKPGLTLCALTAELATRGVHVDHDTVWRFVCKAGQTVQKDPDGGGAVSAKGSAFPGALEGASAPA